jgi:hypothetical protein
MSSAASMRDELEKLSIDPLIAVALGTGWLAKETAERVIGNKAWLMAIKKFPKVRALFMRVAKKGYQRGLEGKPEIHPYARMAAKLVAPMGSGFPAVKAYDHAYRTGVLKRKFSGK